MTRQSLLRKYIVVLAALVCGALIVSGLLQTFFAFQESQAALATIQREKAASAAGSPHSVDEIERLVTGALSTPSVAGNPTLELRRNDFVRLLRQAPAIMDVSYLDRTGREQVRISRLDLNVLGSQTDRSREQAFVSTRQGATYYGPVYFQNASEPFMSLGVPERGADGGAVVAEVDLEVRLGRRLPYQSWPGGICVRRGRYPPTRRAPDISQVLRRADLSSLPQMQNSPGAAVAQTGGTAMIARDMAGDQVLTAREPIPQLGWWVFVEQPLEEAFAPLYASLLRTALLLVAGIGLSVAASLVLARRMVTPIQALQAATARFGAGRLDTHRGQTPHRRQARSIGRRL